MRIGIDVDGVLAYYTPTEWGYYTFKDFGNRLNEFKTYESFRDNIEKQNGINVKNPYLWWENWNLYDDLKFEPFVTEFLFRITSPRDEIKILSDCYKEHTTSKVNFLVRNMIRPFTFTDTNGLKDGKAWHQCDVYIDDKPQNLVQCKKKYPASKTILISHFYNSELNSIETQCIDEIIDIKK